MQDEIVIRRLQQRDEDALANLVAQFRVSLKEPRGERMEPDSAAAREEVAYYSHRNYPIFVAEGIGAGLVGYLVCRMEGKVVWAESLYVRPEFRRQGIASSLYAQAEQVAEERGGTTLFNWVHPNNLAAIRFLKKRGYNVLNLIELRRPVGGESSTKTIRVGTEEFNY